MKLVMFNSELEKPLKKCFDEWLKHEQVDFYLVNYFEKLPFNVWITFVESLKEEQMKQKSYCRSYNYALMHRNRCLGIVSIRLDNNDSIYDYLGHIGYSIAYDERGKGYGNIILDLTLNKCKELGFEKVLITCQEDNMASKKIILKNGGVFEKRSISIEGCNEFYWFDLKNRFV